MVEELEGTFISGGVLVNYPGLIKSIKKSNDPMQPVYEAFTNSIESIEPLGLERGKIILRLRLINEKRTDGNRVIFHSFQIEDIGIGLDQTNFERVTCIKDDSKSANNRGSGRIQFVHFFKFSEYDSNYQDNDGSLFNRKLVLSNSPRFGKENAFILDQGNISIEGNTEERRTILTFKEILADKDEVFYSNLTAIKIKEYLLKHYMMIFCNLKKLPEIIIEEYVDSELKNTLSILKDDIPSIDKTLEFSTFYSQKSTDGKSLVETDKKEVFKVISFIIDAGSLDRNQGRLTSKGQILREPTLDLSFLSPEDKISNQRYLFLLSSDFINLLEGDERGTIELLTSKEFLEDNNVYTRDQKIILLDNIEQNFNETIINAYPEIQVKNEKKLTEIETLKQMFLLDENILKEISISINDTPEKILSKVYKVQAQNTAKSDAIIKEELDNIKSLNPKDKNYLSQLAKCADIVTKQMPIQNRSALTQYVARRGLVLNLFQKALNRELEIQKEDNRNLDESILHNILFQQRTDAVEISDLWMLNEDFMLYTGCSESELKNIKYKDEYLLKRDEELTQEQIVWRDSLGKKRYQCRIDTILFPDENKCVILEYKSPNVLLTERITQVHNYASLIRNFAKDKFDITMFYGYLIGNGVNEMDLMFNGTGFKPSHDNNYYYSPNREIEGAWDKKNRSGALYMEIITYDKLLERAFRRNKLLFDKLNIDFTVKQK